MLYDVLFQKNLGWYSRDPKFKQRKRVTVTAFFKKRRPNGLRTHDVTSLPVNPSRLIHETAVAVFLNGMKPFWDGSRCWREMIQVDKYMYIYIYVYDVFFSKMDGSIDIWWCMDRFSPATCPREKALSNPCFSLQKDGGLVQVKRIVLVQGAEWEIWGLVEMVEIWWCMRNLYRWNNLGGDIDIFLSDTIQEEESAKKAFEEYVVSMNWSQSLLLCMMGNWRLMLEMMAKLVTFSLFDRSDWCDLEMPESVAQFHFAPETSPKRFSTFPTISHSWRVVTCCNRL